MGRPREFDESAVLDAARDAFWSTGVLGTSISGLSAATGLSVGSLYKAFGSKQGIAHRVLRRYLDAGYDSVRRTLDDAPTPLDGLGSWLDAMAQRATTGGATAGCLAVNCATELSGHDATAMAMVGRHDARLRRRIAAAVAAAQEAGQIDGAHDPDAAARLLCAVVNGVQVEGRKGMSPDEARGVLRAALDGLR